MIVDKVGNIIDYKCVQDNVLDFIAKLNPDIEPGRYVIDDNNYANVEEYLTKDIDDAKFESHREYIDIQILLNGKERIYYDYVKDLSSFGAYNDKRDIMFFEDPVKSSDYVTLGRGNFALIFPHEAHAPQIAINASSRVKKVVIKMKI